MGIVTARNKNDTSSASKHKLKLQCTREVDAALLIIIIWDNTVSQ